METDIMSFKIVVDSCCELPEEYLQDPRFEIVPLGLEVGDYRIQDDESFDQAEFLKKVAESPQCPRSACPSPEKFREAYCTEAEHVYAITLSSHLSGSYNSAVLGMNLYREKYGKKQIHVVDSESASCGETQIVKKLVELEEQGLPFEEIVKQMVGRELNNVYPPKDDYRTDETVLKVSHLTSILPNSFKDCSFELKRGEILGFGGLVGAQRTELMEAIFGMRHIESGTVEILGKEAHIKRPQDAINSSVGMITEDRRGTGIFGCLSIDDNTAIASYKHYTHMGKINKKEVDDVVKDSIAKLKIKTPSGKTLIQSLSGGNQQKVIIARWLANNPDILIMDEPTRGIDVGAKYEIYQIMIDLVKQGKSIIMISSEMPELIGMSNRIIVMCNGHITGEVEGEDATQEKIMSFATKFTLSGKENK